MKVNKPYTIHVGKSVPHYGICTIMWLQIPWPLFLTLHQYNLSKWHRTLPLSDSCRTEGKFTEAELILKKWLSITEELLGEQSILVGRILVHLGWVYDQLQMYNESR